MEESDLLDALKWEEPTPENLFSCISTLSKYIMEHGATDTAALDAIIRLRDAAEHGQKNAAISDAIFSLCREAGLFPYMVPAGMSWRDQVAYEFFRGPADVDYVFHREQRRAFEVLRHGKSLVLSAPTSFGKSVLIHAFIAEKKPKCVVVVVPTIALLDQFRRRLSQYFGSNYTIITRNDQAVDPKDPRIYVLTQERLLDRDDIEEIDLLAIDEYYKLDNRRDRQGEGSRSALLNAALRRFLNSAKQIFFLGPTVAEIPMREDIEARFEKITSGFSTVAVDVHNHANENDAPKTLATLLKKYKSDKSLIFSKSPPAARRLANSLKDRNKLATSKQLSEFTDWLAENYHPNWPLVTALRSGYGLHHGSIPRSIAQAVVRNFNEGDLQCLICTSTLIEGVNTTAKNVFIFDKKISNSNYDYFDFRNIAGRSGRMGHHFVGRIFLFNDPPSPDEYQLQIPALAEDDKLPTAVLLNLPDSSLGPASVARKQAILNQSSFPENLIKSFAPYGENSLENASQEVETLLKSGDRSLLWRGRVGFQELAAVFEIGWRHLRFNRARLSPRAAAFFANRLRGARNLRDYFDGLVRERSELEHAEIIERGFRALSAFDYSIPKVLIDLEALIKFHCDKLKIDMPDYGYMAQALDNLFRHHWIKALDEYGVPFPLGVKLSFLVEELATLDDAIVAVRSYAASVDGKRQLSSMDAELINAALS
jgi:superfamily II DNA/RNA helicase